MGKLSEQELANINAMIQDMKKEYRRIEKICLKNDNIVDKKEFEGRLKTIHTGLANVYARFNLGAKMQKKNSYDTTRGIYESLVFEYDKNAKKVYEKLEKISEKYNKKEGVESQKYFEYYNKGLYTYRLRINELEAAINMDPHKSMEQVLLVHKNQFLPNAEKWAPKVSETKTGLLNLTFKGESFSLPDLTIIKRIITNIERLRRNVENVKEAMRRFDKEVRNGGKDSKWIAKMTTAVSESLASTSFPSTDIFNKSLDILKNAQKYCDDFKLAKSVEILETFESAYNDAVKVWNKYQEDTIGGAEKAILWLEGIKFTSFGVVSIYTGGALAGAMGGGAGATVLASGAVAGGESLVDSTATMAGKKLAGDDVKWSSEAGKALKKALVKGALAAFTTAFCKYLLKGCIDKVSEKIANKLGLVDAIDSKVVSEMYAKSAKDLPIIRKEVADRIPSMLERAMNNPQTTSQVLRKLTKALLETGPKLLLKPIKSGIEKSLIDENSKDEKVIDVMIGEWKKYEGDNFKTTYQKELFKVAMKSVIEGLVTSKY